MLRGRPLRLVEAADAQAALSVLEAQDVAVLISDETMPGMNGVTLLGVVRERWPKVARVLFTGDASSAPVEAAMREGVIDALLVKGASDALGAEIARIVARYAAGP
jgi:DNA-binding NtrC family response regulator